MRTKGIVLDRDAAMPLQRQLEAALREAILLGELKPGERILASRELRTHLGLSRNTIVNALAQLQAEGYLVTVRSSGTFVADVLQGRTKGARADAAVDDDDLMPTPLSAAFRRAQPLARNMQGAIPFRPGVPAIDRFPVEQFRRGLAAKAWDTEVFDYPIAFGDRRLREAIAQRLHQTRGIACSSDQIVVTGGAQAAFNLIARVLLARGESVVVEEPGYPSVRAVFLAEGARVFYAPVDNAGIRIGTFANRRARLVHTTPSHQYPTGAVMSLERRLALLSWARKQDAWVIEDDYDSEFNYTGRAQPALHSLDDEHRVLYVGTFSKSLAPGLRVAYIVLPASLRLAFEAAQNVAGATPATVVQRALASFMENGHFGRHITRMRKLYDERRRFASTELIRLAGSAVDLVDTRAGLHFIALLPKEISDERVSSRAVRKGIITPALSKYYNENPTTNGLVIGYAASDIAAAKRAIAKLVELL
jgi:GntR family transcriptional regulator / MocR family aminotransferase